MAWGPVRVCFPVLVEIYGGLWDGQRQGWVCAQDQKYIDLSARESDADSNASKYGPVVLSKMTLCENESTGVGESRLGVRKSGYRSSRSLFFFFGLGHGLPFCCLLGTFVPMAQFARNFFFRTLFEMMMNRL